MEANMADPSVEGWPSFSSEAMTGLDPNLNGVRGIGEFNGKPFTTFVYLP